MIITVACYEGGLGKRSRLRGITGCHQPDRRTGTRHPYCAAIEIRAATREAQHCRAGDRKPCS